MKRFNIQHTIILQRKEIDQNPTLQEIDAIGTLRWASARYALAHVPPSLPAHLPIHRAGGRETRIEMTGEKHRCTSAANSKAKYELSWLIEIHLEKEKQRFYLAAKLDRRSIHDGNKRTDFPFGAQLTWCHVQLLSSYDPFQRREKNTTPTSRRKNDMSSRCPN